MTNKPHFTAKQVAALARAQRAHVEAENTNHTAELRKLWRENARLWKKIAGPGLALSTKILRRDLDTLKRDVTLAVAVASDSTPKVQPPAKAPLPRPLLADWGDKPVPPHRHVEAPKPRVLQQADISF